VAKYKKKRARQLQHDRFRDTAMTLFERFGDRVEGRGRAILYGIGGAVLITALVIFFLRWNHRKTDEAQRALGRAIAIATASVSATATPDATGLTFTSEQERAQKAIEEFQKVAGKYGDPYRTEARYFIATNLLTTDHSKGIAELTELSKSSNAEVAALSKFALGQAKEGDGKLDEAVQIYGDLAKQGSPVVSADTANLRLALVYAKQGKKKEASDLLFNIVDAARKARGDDGLPVPPSGAADEASRELQKLDPDRYAQLPPEAPSLG
jgi:hypothetical protein